MDDGTVARWLRADMRAGIARRAALCGLATGVSVAVGTLVARGEAAVLEAAAWAIAAAIAAVAIVPVTARSRRRAFTRYVQSPPVFVVDESAAIERPDVAGVVDSFRSLGFVRFGQLDAEGTDTRVELLSDGALTVAAVHSPSELVMLMTSLGDDAVLVTGPLLTVPGHGVVANVVYDVENTAMFEAHRHLAGDVFARQAAAADPAELFIRLQAKEVAAVTALGTSWAAMLDLRCRPWWPRLAVGPSAERILWTTGSRFLDRRAASSQSTR